MCTILTHGEQQTMDVRPRSGRTSLKRELATIKAAERRASTWLIRVSLFLLVLGWAYNEYYASRPSDARRTTPTGRARLADRGDLDLKPFLLGAGAA